MGEYRDMGNPARVVKKNPALAASPLVQDYKVYKARIRF
jgi:hypothetical protein